MKTQTRYIAMLLLMLLQGIALPAQQNNPQDRYLDSEITPRTFDRQRWQQLTKELDYTEHSPRTENLPAGETPEDNAEDTRSGPSPTQLVVARILLFILAAVLIAVLLWSLMGYRSGPDNPTLEQDRTVAIDIEQVEKDIHNSDLEKYLLQAQEQGQYNLAIRLYYLAVLRSLSQRQYIRWKPDKTNREYLREMRVSDDYADFRELTLAFERIWYADRKLSQAAFEQLAPSFRRFLDRISQDAKADVL